MLGERGRNQAISNLSQHSRHRIFDSLIDAHVKSTSMQTGEVVRDISRKAGLSGFSRGLSRKGLPERRVRWTLGNFSPIPGQSASDQTFNTNALHVLDVWARSTRLDKKGEVLEICQRKRVHLEVLFCANFLASTDLTPCSCLISHSFASQSSQQSWVLKQLPTPRPLARQLTL